MRLEMEAAVTMWLHHRRGGHDGASKVKSYDRFAWVREVVVNRMNCIHAKQDEGKCYFLSPKVLVQV